MFKDNTYRNHKESSSSMARMLMRNCSPQHTFIAQDIIHVTRCNYVRLQPSNFHDWCRSMSFLRVCYGNIDNI